MRRYDEQDSGPVGSLSAGKSELHGKNSQQKVNLTNIGRKWGRIQSWERESGKGLCYSDSEWLLQLYTREEDLVLDNQQQLEHENWSVDWKDYCDMLVKTGQQGRHKTRNNFLDSSEPMRTFRNTIPILIFRISNALGIVSLRPDIIYDFENVNLNLDLYLYPHALGKERGKLQGKLNMC